MGGVDSTQFMSYGEGAQEDQFIGGGWQQGEGDTPLGCRCCECRIVNGVKLLSVAT